MNNKLKPCPFCGGEAFTMAYLDEDEFLIKKEYKYSVICRKCHAESRCSPIKEEAIEAWNTRKPMDKVVERLTDAAKSGEVIMDSGVRRVSCFVQINDAIEIMKGEME